MRSTQPRLVTSNHPVNTGSPNAYAVRKSRYSEEKMVAILREADRSPVAEVAKKHAVSEQTIYNWRQHFGTMDSADVKRLRQLEQENGRLKKMVADRDLEIDVMKEITAKKW